jgi:hypothetical protein
MSLPLILNSSLTCDVASELFERHSKKIISFKEQIASQSEKPNIFSDLFQREKILLEKMTFDNLQKKTNQNPNFDFPNKFLETQFQKNMRKKGKTIISPNLIQNLEGGYINEDEEEFEKPIEIELKLDEKVFNLDGNKVLIDSKTNSELTDRPIENLNKDFEKIGKKYSLLNSKATRSEKDAIQEVFDTNLFKLKIPENLFKEHASNGGSKAQEPQAEMEKPILNEQIRSEKFLDESIQAHIQNLSSMLDKSILTENQNKIFLSHPTQTERVFEN